jgi:hypothetical protein
MDPIVQITIILVYLIIVLVSILTGYKLITRSSHPSEDIFPVGVGIIAIILLGATIVGKALGVGNG